VVTSLNGKSSVKRVGKRTGTRNQVELGQSGASGIKN
jgi:hypothetical protein